MIKDSDGQPTSENNDLCASILVEVQRLYPDLLLDEQLEELRRIIENEIPLSPKSLETFQPAYSKFVTRDDLHPFLYVNQRLEFDAICGRRPIMVAFLGPSSSGKDTILDLIPAEMFTRLQTSTTRQRTDRDKPITSQPRYEFLSLEDFNNLLKGNGFIEFIKQGEDYYGTRKKAVEDVLATSEPIKIWRGELTGVVAFREWMNVNYPDIPFVTCFVLPNMPLSQYCELMEKHRGTEDVRKWRLPKAMWDIYFAAERSDVILLNPFEQTEVPRRATEATRTLFEIFLGS